ncbi:MAG: hypothetical protein ACT4QD_12645 [Acidobacteriota bacterium]
MNTREIARVLGRRGGRARAARLSAEERRRIASLGGQARRRSIGAKQRVLVNLRHARMIVSMRGGAERITRMKRCSGPIPGLYPAKR